jgi:alcohol dehydrogenase (NADP+)
MQRTGGVMVTLQSPIPDAIPSAEAAPMLCGGVTTYSPLKDNGAGPGKRIGIIGIGGLGHFGLLWAKALGCDKVVAISRKSNKKADALKMGADAFIATDEDKGWVQNNQNSLDLIVCTVSGPNLPLVDYLELLDVKGTFIQVGAPEDPIPQFHAFALIRKNVKVGGSSIGSPATIREMFALAAQQRVKAWIQERPIGDANQAIVDMENGEARYRYVLVN